MSTAVNTVEIKILRKVFYHETRDLFHLRCYGSDLWNDHVAVPGTTEFQDAGT